MEEERPVDAPQHGVGPTVPVPEQNPQQEETPAKPVDDPDLPETGDPTDFEEDPVPEDDFTDAEEAAEKPEDPIDLSGVDKEFEE